MASFLGSVKVPLATPVSAAEGQLYFNTNTKQLMIYSGSAWQPANGHQVRELKTWIIAGEIQVASGQTNFIPSFFVSLAGGQTAKLVEARYKLGGGTNCVVHLTQNGSTIGAPFNSITVTSSAAQATGSVTLAEDDEIALVVDSVSGTPTNLSFTVVLESTF